MGASPSKPPMAMIVTPPSAPKPAFSFMSILTTLVIVSVVFGVVVFVSRMTGASASAAATTDLAPGQVDGKSGMTMPSGVSGSTMGVQFWMFVNDWEYRHGTEKSVLTISDPTNSNIVAPAISLHPTSPDLLIKVSVHSSSSLQTTNTGHGEIQTITVENIPLQAWFAVSVTIYQQNVDVYINGRLVQSATLGGVPRPANGNITVGGMGGFSGSVCTIHAGSTKLEQSNAAAFYGLGTACSSSGVVSASSQLNNLSLFGYTFVFGVKDGSGKSVAGLSSSDVSNYFGSST